MDKFKGFEVQVRRLGTPENMNTEVLRLFAKTGFACNQIDSDPSGGAETLSNLEK